MKVHHFNEFRFIHDNRPDIRYAICYAFDGGCLGLHIDWTVEGTGEYSKKDFQEYTRCNRVKIIKYSDLIQSKGIRHLLGRISIWTYDVYIVDFHK